MNLNEMQKKVFENKVKRGFNTTDVGKEVILITEELGELAKAFRDNNKEEIADAIGDIMIYCLGLCEIVGVSAEELLQKIIENNKIREHRSQL